VDADTGWVVGGGGIIRYTTNGGTNWIVQNSGTSDDLRSVTFENARQGWVVGGVYQSFATILHTTNGGSTWITQYRAAPNFLFGVAFVDTSQGWAVGASILHTTNGGSTWVAQYTYSSYYLSSVSFVDAHTGWAAGSNGTILRSSLDINGVENVLDQIISATPMAESTIPTEYALYQNYPNPFNSSTTIRFDIKEAGRVSIKVFDLLGREVVTLVNEQLSAGTHTVSWDALGVASGIYLYRIKSGEFSATRKLLLLK
jgi:hypothetical protein